MVGGTESPTTQRLERAALGLRDPLTAPLHGLLNIVRHYGGMTTQAQPTYGETASARRPSRIGSRDGAPALGYVLAGGFSLLIWAALLTTLVRF